MRNAEAEPRKISGMKTAAWLLVVLAAVMQVYDGLSSILLPFLGDRSVGKILTAWMVTTGASQLIVAVLTLIHATRKDLRDATIGVAASILLGWLTTVPAAVQHGLDFRAEDWLTPGYFVLSPLIALTATALAWRGSHPILAALVVTAPTTVGLLAVVAFAISIALYGF